MIAGEIVLFIERIIAKTSFTVMLIPHVVMREGQDNDHAFTKRGDTHPLMPGGTGYPL